VEIHNRCVNIIANLFHAPLEEGQQAVGTSTVGSSEAIMLAQHTAVTFVLTITKKQ